MKNYVKTFNRKFLNFPEKCINNLKIGQIFIPENDDRSKAIIFCTLEGTQRRAKGEWEGGELDCSPTRVGYSLIESYLSFLFLLKFNKM